MEEENYPSSKTIKSVNEYIEYIQGIKEKWDKKHPIPNFSYIWFRGQGYDYPLKPTILREVKDNYTNKILVYNEMQIVETFKAIYKNYTTHRLETKLELFSYMQHYGVPTRLLDWTEGSLNALFFSICNLKNNKDDKPIVYILHSGKLNSISMEAGENGPFLPNLDIVKARLDLIGFIINNKLSCDFFKKNYYEGLSEDKEDNLKYPISIYPESNYNIRIASQKGCFTLHGYSNISINELFKKQNQTEFLIKINIDVESIDLIYKELKTLGITYRSIYPDIEGLALELKDRLNMRIK